MNRKEEKLLREFVRRTIILPAKQKLDEERRNENKARLWIRSLIREAIIEKEFTVINEAKDSSNPHPKTSINFLRDSFKKLIPNLEKDYKMLTTSEDQRESFKNHYLAAMIRMFDQADGLSASVEIEDYSDLGTEPVLKSPDEAPEETPDEGAEDTPEATEEAPEGEDTGDELDSLMADLDTLQEGNDELDKELKEVDVDVVSDLKPKEEKGGLEGDIEKGLSKKSDVEADREKFGAGVGGDVTGRNKAYDSFKNNHNYVLSNYQDLSDMADKEEFKKWCVYNLKLTFDGFDEELQNNPETPEIANPEQQA
jgi:hypothetical protein